MAIKKTLYRRQPGCFFFFGFSLCPLAATRDCIFSLLSGICAYAWRSPASCATANKVPVAHQLFDTPLVYLILCTNFASPIPITHHYMLRHAYSTASDARLVSAPLLQAREAGRPGCFLSSIRVLMHPTVAGIHPTVRVNPNKHTIRVVGPYPLGQPLLTLTASPLPAAGSSPLGRPAPHPHLSPCHFRLR